MYHLSILPRNFQTHPKLILEHQEGVYKIFWRITGQPRLEGTSENCLIQSFMRKGAQVRLSSILLICTLKASNDGNSTTWGGCSHNWLYSLWKISFLYGNLPWKNWYPLPLLCVAPWEGRASALSVAMFQNLKFCGKALPWVFSFPDSKDLTLSVFPHRAHFPAFWSSNVSLQNYSHPATKTEPILSQGLLAVVA